MQSKVKDANKRAKHSSKLAKSSHTAQDVILK